MKKSLSTLLIGSIAFISLPISAGNHSTGEIYSGISVISSVGSSALVSGILLSPIGLPVILVQISIEKSNKPDDSLVYFSSGDSLLNFMNNYGEKQIHCEHGKWGTSICLLALPK